jgi:hypothetical protein
MSLKLLTDKLKSVMHDASHSREGNNQRDPNKSAFLVQYKRISMFLIILYTMGLATFVSIQIGLMHLSPKIFSTDVSILNNARWISETVYFNT